MLTEGEIYLLMGEGYIPNDAEKKLMDAAVQKFAGLLRAFLVLNKGAGTGQVHDLITKIAGDPATPWEDLCLGIDARIKQLEGEIHDLRRGRSSPHIGKVDFEQVEKLEQGGGAKYAKMRADIDAMRKRELRQSMGDWEDDPKGV
jgi:hypothetical protein